MRTRSLPAPIRRPSPQAALGAARSEGAPAGPELGARSPRSAATSRGMHAESKSGPTVVGVRNRSVRIVIVDGRPLMRRCLSELLQGQPELPDLQVLGLFSSVDELRDWPGLEGTHAPFVLVCDFTAARQAQPSALAELRSQTSARVILIGVPPTHSARAVCTRVGAESCLLFEASFADLVTTIQALAQGLPSPSAATPPRKPNSRLTARETQILKLVAEGYTNQEIATKLFLEHQTVKNHIRSAFKKLGLHTRLEVIRQNDLAADLE